MEYLKTQMDSPSSEELYWENKLRLSIPNSKP